MFLLCPIVHLLKLDPKFNEKKKMFWNDFCWKNEISFDSSSRFKIRGQNYKGVVEVFYDF